MQDAYTTSNWFPSAAPPVANGTINYIRNSVKVVIDAYNGVIDFYLVDPVGTDGGNLPAHIPKPVQTVRGDAGGFAENTSAIRKTSFGCKHKFYRAYHMEKPEVFYNREDLWQFPREPTSFDGTDGLPRMSPYYIIMRLPGEKRAEFFLFAPHGAKPTPEHNRVAGRSLRPAGLRQADRLRVSQRQARLRAIPNRGAYSPETRRIAADLAVEPDGIEGHPRQSSRIPIENSLLYVSTLYLRAETGQLPELKRVIAASGDRVVMEETLSGALAALFKEAASGIHSPAAPEGALAADAITVRAREALSHYDRALERLRAGDWSGFGAELDALRPLLEQLSQRPERSIAARRAEALAIACDVHPLSNFRVLRACMAVRLASCLQRALPERRRKSRQQT